MSQFTMQQDSKGSEEPNNDNGTFLEAKSTVYFDAQVLPFPDPTPRQNKPNRNGCCGFFCCFDASPGEEQPLTPVPMDDMGRARKLSSIKETSLTKEQIMRKDEERVSPSTRKMTKYLSFGEDSAVMKEVIIGQEPKNVVQEEKVSVAASIVRKLSRKLTGNRDAPVDEKESGGGILRKLTSRILTRQLTQEVPLNIELMDADFESLSRFHGIWYSYMKKNVPKNAELARVMSLGWGLRKALDNVAQIEFVVGRHSFKNTAKVFGLIDIREERPWSGERVKMKRKDLRGMATTWIERIDEGFVVQSEWPDPLAAYSREVYTLTDANTMQMGVQVTRATGESCDIKFYFSRNKL